MTDHERRDDHEDAAAASSSDDAESPSPDLLETLRQIGASGKAGLGAASDATKAMRSLVVADISLARSAAARSLAFAAVAVVFGASSWLLLMTALIVYLNRGVGLTWSSSLLSAAGLSALLAGLGVWRAMRYFEHTRLKATRRQLARLGIGELSDLMPSPGSPQSAREAAKQEDVKIAPKDHSGIDLTPP